MADPTIEEIQRAIDGATAAGDQRAVDVLTKRQSEIRTQMDAPAREEILSGETAALNTPAPMEGEAGALERPSTDTQIDDQLEARLDAGEKPALAEPEPFKLSDRERELATTQYNTDQELLKSGEATPSPDQVNEFMGQVMGNTQWSDPNGRELVIDPKTGETRWTAMAPGVLERVTGREKEVEARGSTSKATVGALGYGGTRVVGSALSSAEAKIEQNNNFQQFLLTGDGLPKSEQDRIMALAREEFGADVDVKKLPAEKVMSWIEMNPENELAFRNIAGDEWWEERKEFGSRLLSKVSSAWSYGTPMVGFGADDPGGALTGQGSYEGIDYTGKRAPSFPGASVMLDDWESDAKSGTGVYEGLVLPLTSGLTDKTPAQHATDYSNSFIEEYYSEEQLAEREMPIFSGDVEINSIGDLFNSELYTDPNSKLMNPESLLLMFAENAPELAVSYAVTRGSGSVTARATAKNAYGQTVERMNKARETAAGRAGMIAGGGTEALLVQTHLENETRTILDQIPTEVWENNATFQSMVDAGVHPEGAKQIMVQEAASKAGNTAAVITLLTGAPMNKLMAKSAAGRLVQSNSGARRATATVGEPLTEGFQEVMEMLQTESAVKPIDPDNPIFDDPNRYVESFAAGAIISLPFGAAGALEPSQPKGIDKADVDAVRATADYMEATNERFKFETKITAQEHIDNTTPIARLKELDKLEKLQLSEATAILKAAPKMREFLERQGTQTSKVELKMLNRLVMRANAMKTNITVAQSKRTTAGELWEAERQVVRDRAELQQKVNEQIIKLEDIQSLSGSIEAVQNLEAISSEQETELIKEGYARRNKDGQLVVLPKGRRATKELNRQGRALQGKLDKGYTGEERRQSENLVKRDLVDSAGPVETEQMLYQDNLTGAQNRRAFNERQENIDKKTDQDSEPTQLQKARNGDHEAQEQLSRFGLGWDGDKTKYRLTGKGEVDSLLAGGSVSSTRQESGITDVTDNPDYAKVSGDSDHRITFKKTDKFDSDLEGSGTSIREKNKGAGEYHLTGGYSLSDVQTIEQRQTDGTWKEVYSSPENNGIEGAAPAVAAVDVDSLAWVNDTMGHSAGDRLLLAVSDVIGKQAGVEVFRLGGDEFVVTGASQEALETAMQAAAAELSETEVIVGEDVVTPQITWGKGENYESADAESLTMKQDRQARNIVAPRKKKAATYKHRAQQGLFMKDGATLPRHWHRISHKVKRGDMAEILTPDGAVHGVVTNISNKRGRARLKVMIQNREFLFNPSSNHLIIPKGMDPADLAWITGDADYAAPGRETLPQTLVDINIAGLSNNEGIYADLADDFEYDTPLPWWMEDHPDMSYHPTIPYMPVEKKANDAQIAIALRIARELTEGMSNLPKINVVRDLDSLRKEYPGVLQQIKNELGGSNISGVRGYMDHLNPENGIFIFPAHVTASVGSSNYEMGIMETVWHELIGHYGVRGMFGNEAELRTYMHDLVDSFPRLADYYASTLGLDKSKPDHKQLLGEEMVAYLAGQVKAGKEVFSNKQKNIWARFLAWIKSIMMKRNMDRYAPVKKFVSIHETKENFWNDSRVRDLLSRSRDFVRHADGFKWTPLEDTTKPFARDRDIFRAGLITAMNTATFKPSNREKGELAKRYGGKANVPNEVPLFPDSATPNNWKQLIIKAQKEKYMSARELELSGLSDKSNFSLFRDGTYGTLERYMAQMNGGTAPTRWYEGIFPADVTAELNAINDAMEKTFMVGPLGEMRGEQYRPRTNEATPEMMRTRIAEIMTQKMNPKKTQLTKELMQAHMLSENVYRVFVSQQGDHERISYEQAIERLFGSLPVELTEEQKEMIKAEREKTRSHGYNIGYDKDLDRWFDWAYHTNEYAEWSPQGSRYTQDFRVALIKSEGAGGEMGYSGHYDPNIMHIRTGVAELLEWDGMPELDFPNEAMKGKMLSLIELQSDWLQKLRKGFSSGDEKDAAEQEYGEKRKLLHMVGDQFGRGVSQDIWQVVNDTMRPILNLPDGSVEGMTGTAFGGLRDRAREELGQAWEDLTKDQKNEIWKRHAIEELDKVAEVFRDARDGVNETLTKLNETSVAGSMDARGFEYLDGKAMHRVAASMKGELDKVIDTIHNTLRYADSQLQMVEAVKRLKNDFGKHMDRISSGSNYDEGLRMPMIGYQLRPFLETLYGRTGANANRIAELLSGLGTREMATMRIPNVVLSDANTAMMTGYDPISLMNEIISPSRVSRHSDIAPGELVMDAVRAGDDFIDVKVLGNKADVQKATELLPKLVKTWMENHAADKRRISIATRNQPSLSTVGDQEYDWSEMESLFNFEEEDTDGEQSNTMRDQGVESFYDFESNDDGDHLASIIEYAYDNMTEGDWDNLEEYNDGVSRQGDTYRNEVQIDEDGGVDNEAAEEALTEAREDYRRDEMYDDDTFREEASDRIREEWQERGPTALIQGSLPVSWDEDGEPTQYVSMMIIAKEAGDSYDMIIDGEDHDYESDLDDAKSGMDGNIRSYYESNEITPPPGAAFGPDTPPAPEPVTDEEAAGPNWDIVRGNMVENMSMMSDESQKMDKVFERFVVVKKRIEYGQVHPDSPVSKDEQWRPLALKYLIADAVRRGLGGVMWNNGLSSSTRGGMGQSGVQPTRRISWSKENVGIRGEEQEVYVIRYPEQAQPMVVSRSSMVPVLGADVAKLIYMQESGKLETPELPGAAEENEDGTPNRDKYILSTTNNDTTAIYRRSDNAFLGFAQDEETINTIITQDAEQQARPPRRRGSRPSDELPPTGEPLGEVLSQGLIDEEMAGGLINVMVGDSIGGYQETFARPRLAGARQSYEDITVRMWNKELKQYGVHISDTYVKANDMQKAMTEEGQATMKSPKRDEQIAEQHGRLHVAELTGEMHGWVIMSEKKGPLLQDVWTDQVRAEARLNEYIAENFGSDREGVKVMYFPITEQMREEFSGPVAPFHYDPKQDPKLKTAAKKVGYQPKTLTQRAGEFREGLGAEMRQGMIDQFYGLRRALNAAGEGDGAYISARLTTSLDSMMKAVLYYGHPVWKDGIVQNEGRGLLDILQPILGDPDTWGLYMAGKRGKSLMLEGYGNLKPEMKAAIDAAAEQFGGGTDGIWELLVRYSNEQLFDHIEVKEADLTKEERDALSPLERKYWDSGFLDHAKRDMQPKKGSKTGAPSGRWQIFDWREESKRNTVGNIAAKYKAGSRWLLKKGVKDEAAAKAIMDKLTELALKKQMQADMLREKRVQSSKAAAQMIQVGREHLFDPAELDSMVKLADKLPHFKTVAKDYAAFNKKMLDFGEASGIIDGETRATWESADYVPFYRVDDNRLAGSGMSPTSGIANQRAPIRRLRGGKENVSDIIGNIMMNVTKLVDASAKNNAALESIDALRGSGIISKKPMEWKPEMIPMAQMKKVLIDKGVIVPDGEKGIHLSDIPADALTGMQKMFAIKAPEGDGIVSVMRDGKREYYYTDDMLLYRSLGAINKKHFGEWINLFRAPKRLLTTLITIDPSFMLANFIRDTGSAFVTGRDNGNLPVLSAIKGFSQALMEDETMRTLVGAGAAFENGYITGGDPRQTRKMLKAAMEDKSFVGSVLDTPKKLVRAWLHLGSSIENSNRMAVYNAAIAAGKSKKRAAYEAKDLMDFSMGGDWPVVQFLIQTVPFMNARAQGMYRLGRGAREHPVAFTIKGLLISLAGLSLFGAFKDDERYKSLQPWDRHAYYHWWVGDTHYRLPKPFEVGAIFNTIPEMFFNYRYDKETDAGKTLMKEFAHMMGQTFSMSPIPQTLAPIREMNNNMNYFRGRPIVSYYQSKRLPPDQYNYRTSPLMIELAKRLPEGLDTVSGKIRSPLHLQNLYAGYTGTIGRYALQAADWGVERMLDYPLPPSPETQDYAVLGRFNRGDNPPRNTKYETEVYAMLDKVTAIQGSLSFHEKQGNVEEYLKTHTENAPYIRAASSLENVRENIQSVNAAIMQITINKEKEKSETDGEFRDRKQEEIDTLEETRNTLFKEAWKLRPGGEYNPVTDEGVETSQVIDMIDEWGVDNSTAYMRRIEENAPTTAELLEMVSNSMSIPNLASLAKTKE